MENVKTLQLPSTPLLTQDSLCPCTVHPVFLYMFTLTLKSELGTYSTRAF